MVVGGGETQQELIPFKHKEWLVVYRPGIVGVDDNRDGCMALEGTRFLKARRLSQRQQRVVSSCNWYWDYIIMM